MMEVTDKISYPLEVGLFHRIPEIGEKNPLGEVSFEGYERQKIYYPYNDEVNFSCTDNAGATVIAGALLDKNNTVIKVIYL